MKRCSLLTGLVCLLTTSGAFAQQYRPIEPRNDTPYRAYQSSPENGRRQVRPARYQDDIQLEDGRGPWTPGPANRPIDAADASRSVADQLRQQYHATAQEPELRHSAARGPVYYPSAPPQPTYSADQRPRSTVVEPIRYSRPTARGYDEPRS
ncbi:MAG: hypothetical protein Q8M16_07730, partial [Pirellulaceae bacterium]|nr:hypothetical protein [Pirellulaceae bacterium]